MKITLDGISMALFGYATEITLQKHNLPYTPQNKNKYLKEITELHLSYLLKKLDERLIIELSKKENNDKLIFDVINEFLMKNFNCLE